MSRESLKVKQFDSNDDEEKYDTKQKSWNYPDPFVTHQNQGRTCSSPADELDVMGVEEKCSTRHSVEVQTERSAFFSLRQDKRVDNNNKKINLQTSNKEFLDQPNEFLHVKLRKTGLGYEHEKTSGKFTVNINTQALDECAETDLDQPMDYTLCYNETNLDEEKKENTPKNEFLCIEETVEEKIEIVKPKGSINKDLSRNKKDMFSSGRSFKEIFNFFKDRDKKRSHESSKSSSSEGSKLLKTSETYEQKVERSPQSTQSSVEQSEKESKLKVDAQVAQQTPLIFSRCSSLGSLTGFEQSSINDDRSSVVSDFSHKTSGRVSPSELPDSPAQLAPPNIRSQQKCQIGCFGKKKIPIPQSDKLKFCQQSTVSNDNSYLQIENNLKKLPLVKTSVFEDYLTSFKDESTPTKLHSMAASSLSSLTIDDDDDFELVNKNILNKEKQNVVDETKVETDRQEPIGESNNEAVIAIKQDKNESVSYEQDDLNREEEDQLTNLTPYEEQLLDECIRRGIAKWTKQNMNEIKPFSWDVGFTCLATKALLANKIRTNAVDILKEIVEKHNSYQNDLTFVNNNNNNLQQNIQNNINEDNNEKYSDKNLNTNDLVLNAVENNNNNSNQITENPSYTTYEEYLLDQCIRRGIAKITKININDIRPFSWDTNQICLTTRAMMLHNYNDDIYTGTCAT